MGERKAGRVLVVGLGAGRALLDAAQSVADRTGGSVVVVDDPAPQKPSAAILEALEDIGPHPVECLNPPRVVHPCPERLKAPPWRQPRKGGRRRG